MHRRPRTPALDLAVALAAALALPASVAGCAAKKEPASQEVATRPSAGSAARRPPPPPAPPRPLAPLAPDPGAGDGKVSWGVAFGGLGIDSPHGVATGPDGAAYVAGYFEGASTFADLGSRTSAGGADAFLVRLDRGKPAWVRTWGAGRDDTARAVATRGDTVVVVGNFLDALQLGEFRFKAAGSDDLYVAAFDPRGEVKWLWTSGGIDSDGANAVAPTPDGGWIVGGSFTGEGRFGDATLRGKGGTDALLVKLAATGDVEWVKQLGGRYNDTITSVAVDPAGGIYTLGAFRDVADWGGPPLTAAGGADNDVVLAKFDARGEHQWSRRFGDKFDDVAGAVAVDPAGNVTMTGAFDREISFGPGDRHRSAGESDAFVARFDTRGTLLWARTFGGDREDVGFGVDADAAGGVVAVGWFQGKVDLGRGPVESRGNKDGYVVKLDARGEVRWARGLGDRDHDKARAVALDADGGAVVTGPFRFGLDLVSPALESSRAPGNRIPEPDTFVVRFER